MWQCVIFYILLPSVHVQCTCTVCNLNKQHRRSLRAGLTILELKCYLSVGRVRHSDRKGLFCFIVRSLDPASWVEAPDCWYYCTDLGGGGAVTTLQSRVNIQKPFIDKVLKLSSLAFAVSRKAMSSTARSPIRISWSGNLALNHQQSWVHCQISRCQRHYSLVAASKTCPQSRTFQVGTGMVQGAVEIRPNRWREY